MNKHFASRHNSTSASALQITLAVALVAVSAILFASSFKATVPTAPSLTTALGNYPNTLIPLSGDTTVMPDTTPTDTTSINVSTNSNFKGTFAASPATGVVTVTDAHPAGAYPVTVTAFGPGGTTTKTFTLTVNDGTPCGAGFTSGFSDPGDVPPFFFNPVSVAIGDFNADGKQDLAVANQSAGTVSIRLGDGFGGFIGPIEVILGPSSGPTSVAIGDFNGDGKQDLAVTNSGLNKVSIHLGDGFGGATEVGVGLAPFSVAIGDFNGDGKQDWAVANANSDNVSIRLGDGSGGFIIPAVPEFMVGIGPLSVAVGDFNGDGKQDLAVANSHSYTVSIRLGNGAGGFILPAVPEVGVGSFPYGPFGPWPVAIGDFDGDGNQDFAAANQSAGTVSIRLGDGLGGFVGAAEVPVDLDPRSVAVGDFNGDGKQDLAVANNGSVTLSIRLGDGLGGFSSAPGVSGYQAYSVAIGDFNGDGKQDLVIANQGVSKVSIRLGDCIPATPTPAPSATPHGSPHATPTPRPHATPTPHPPHASPTPRPPHPSPTPIPRLTVL